MARNEKSRTIDELQQKLSDLREKKQTLNDEAEVWSEKRDKLNAQIRNLRTETYELRSQRDDLNAEVKRLKQLRENTKKTVQEKIIEIKETDQQIKTIAKRKPPESRQTLQRKIDELEWEIQTTPLALQEEKELVDSIGNLEAQLTIHKKLEILRKKINEFQTQLEAEKEENEFHHQKLTETAQKSQEIHKKMLDRISRAKELSAKADNLHDNYVRAMQKIKPVTEEITQVLAQLKLRKQELRREEDAEKKKRQEAIRKNIEKRAKEKLKRGEKLTWEEFQVLAEEEETT